MSSWVQFMIIKHNRVDMLIDLVSDAATMAWTWWLYFYFYSSCYPKKNRADRTHVFAIIGFSPFSRQWQYKGKSERTKKKRNYKDLSVRCWGCICVVCVCEMFVWLLAHVSTSFHDGCVRCVRWNNVFVLVLRLLIAVLLNYNGGLPKWQATVHFLSMCWADWVDIWTLLCLRNL